MKAKLASHVGVLLFAAGVLGRSIADEPTARSVEHRAGWRVLRGDLHSHTRYSDGFLSPFDLVLAARRQGLDVLGVTEHNMIFPAEMAAWFSPLVHGPRIIVGEEVTTRRFHLLALGLRERVDTSLQLPKVIERIHAQGGVAVGAHPVRRFWKPFDAVASSFDGAEVVHPTAYRLRSRGFRWEEMVEWRERMQQRGIELAAIGSSDYHFFKVLGISSTWIFARDDSPGAVLDAIREHRTVTQAPDGSWFGPPALVEALRRDPVSSPGPADYSARGPLDAVARALGFIGLAVLLAFRRGSSLA